MARIEVIMPKMGESIMEGTVVEWSKQIGDFVNQDETLLEIGTDKVDSEVPAPESGVLVEILAQEGDTVEVGEVIAILETDPDAAATDAPTDGAQQSSAQTRDGSGNGSEAAGVDGGGASEEAPATEASSTRTSEHRNGREEQMAIPPDMPGAEASVSVDGETPPRRKGADGRFYSPLVLSIAREEGLSQQELEALAGSGTQGRVTKQDVLQYVEQRKRGGGAPASPERAPATASGETQTQGLRKPVGASAKSAMAAGEMALSWPREPVEVLKMDRMRKFISEHMVRSRQTSAHVTTFGEADVTRLVRYRDRHKERFQRENGFKLTFTPFFVEATIQAIREFPLINSSVDGDEIHLKRDINYGIAVALGESGQGGLVVPVIKQAGDMNLRGLAQATHSLARKARNKELSPDDLAGGTFTLTNYGSVGNLMGTPIINQPQVAIFGTGIIQKRPVVVEVDGTDTIAIRHMVYLSMSYDHRIIDGAMGGAFVQRVKQLLEQFDENRTI